MLRELDFDPQRLHFTGVLPRDRYRDVLLASSVHVYLTVPFVLSWSLIEALAARLRRRRLGHRAGARGAARRRNGLLVDFFDSARLAGRICEVLQRAADGDEGLARVRARACESAAERYAWKTLLPRRAQLLEAVATGLLSG